MNQLRVLIIDDEPAIRMMIAEGLKASGYETETADGEAAAMELLEETSFDVVFCDIHLHGGSDGITVLERLKRHDPELDVILMTGFPELETAIQALRLGAYDYLIKPLSWENLRHLVKRIAEQRKLRGEVRSLRERLYEKPGVDQIVGTSARMKEAKRIIAKVATTESVVLVEGESGTGKELMAGAIHQLSHRAKGPFISVNCGAIPAELAETELFGHVRGAFSGALRDVRGLFRSAQGGTLFLDEIGELPMPLQPKLLRALQEKEVRPIGSSVTVKTDVRIVAATNRNLEDSVKQGTFRQDLFFRLNVVRLEAPSLRSMREDIPTLVSHFLRRFNQTFGRSVRGVSEQALDFLVNHDFPGNVRELENIIERAYALGAEEQIDVDDLPHSVRYAESEPRTLEDAEKDMIRKTLDRCGGDKVRAAGELGVSLRTLYRRIKELEA
jgi:DNA-binding NtrC family response regulator